MPIDRDLAMSAELEPSSCHYGPDDVILYHLGIGAGHGATATQPGELEYTFEKNLKVLPTFSLVASKNTSSGGTDLGSIPGIDIDLRALLHGEQEIELHKPLPTSANFSLETVVEEVYDKGKAALLVLANTARDELGEALFTTRMGLFVRGEGGFGGESGPRSEVTRPDRDPDGSVDVPTRGEQALLYRLSGDKNPLHVDPEFSRMAGFDVPIIHGLCSYGLACKAVVDNVLDGEVERVARYSARFAGVAYPGETYSVSWWVDSDKIVVEAKSRDRDSLVISNAAIWTR